MKAKYIGYAGKEADESPRYVTHLGVTFRRDRWATLPASVTEAQLTKLKQHPHFEVAEGEGEPPEEGDPAEAPETDGAGKPEKLGKAEIIAKLQAIANKNPEFEFNPKLGVAKLAEALEEAEFTYGDED